MAPPRKKKSKPGAGAAKPHAKAKRAARERALLTPDDAWANGIIEKLLADAHPYQLDAIEDSGERISLLWGRGVGKTTVLRVRALIKMLRIPGAIIAYVCTSRPTARKLNWNPLKKLIHELGLDDDFEFHETLMECRCLRNGSVYQFIGADDTSEVEKLRGQPFNEVQIDECASHDNELLEYMLDECVAPRLGERDGCIVLAGTPGHVLRGYFYDATHPGSKLHRPYKERHDPAFTKWISWSSHSCELLDVVTLPDAYRYPAMLKNWDAALREKERHQWSDDNPKWLREYRRRWAANDTTTMYQYRAHAADGKTLFNRWDPLGGRKVEGAALLRAAVAALPREFDDWHFGYGMDLGSRDPFALNIFAFSPSDGMRRFFHVGWFDRRKMYSKLIAELLIGKEATELAMRGEVYTELGGMFGVTGWPVAMVADLAGLGEAIILELQKVYGIKIKAAEKKDKPGAIEVFNGDLVDGRMFILAGSPLEEQLEQLQWKPDEYGHPKEDKAARNDHADSATYIRTELGNMFSAASGQQRDQEDDVDAAAQPSRERAREQPKPKPKPKKADEWDDKPVSSRRRTSGEFGALNAKDDFSKLDWHSSWGND